MPGNDRLNFAPDAHHSRRSFLKLGAATLASVALAQGVFPRLAGAVEDAAAADEFGGLKMGLQSYTLRDRSFDKMLQAMKEDLKLHYVELFPAHLIGLSHKIALEKLKDADVKALSYGVIGFSKDDAANRKLFDLAKELELTNLTCDPDPDSFDSLDKLTEEYGITAAIHDHGPGHRWGKIDTIESAIKDHSKKIGLCCDTGHFIRAGEDPLRAVEVFKDRLYEVHLKDFKKEGNKWEDVPAGDANLNVDGLVKALLAIKYAGGVLIEFEGQKKDDPSYPVTASQTSLGRVREAVKKA
jgi:sugar phosphate isomerase/epimerase